MGGKKILYIDMDGVIVNFDSGVAKLSDKNKLKYNGRYDDTPKIFRLMEPISGAISAIKKLSKYFDVFVLSTAPWDNIGAWTDKIQWIKNHFGDGTDSILYKKVIFTHHKQLSRGHILIDDRAKNGADKFDGEFIMFGSEKFPNWKTVLKYLIPE